MNSILQLLPTLLCVALTFGQAIAQNCTAAFTVGDTDLTIQFTDQSTSPVGDPIVSWFWDFDDNGATSTQQNPVHTFSSPDKYDVELFITTASGCTNNIKIRIEICVLPLNVTVGSCDANGNIPIAINVSDIYDNGKEIDIAIDGNLIPGSPFNIDASSPVNTSASIAGDGLPHTITVQSTDIGTCNNAFTFTAPDCNSNCFLSSFQVNFAGGTTHSINVGSGGNNVFTPNQTTITVGDLVNFNFVDNGHTTTSDANSGPDSWNSGELGVGSTYPVSIQNPGVHPFYCIPHGGPGGAGMSGTIIANCPSGNNFALALAFNTTQANPGGFNVRIDGVNQPGSPFAYNGTGGQAVTVPIAGDGATHAIEVIDVDDPTCVLSTNFTSPNCGAAPSCSLSLNATQTGGCNAANNVNVEVAITSINGSTAGFNLTVDGLPVAGSPFPYDASGTTTLTIEVIGDGQDHTIVATDVNDANCSNSATVMTANCLIPCSLSNLTASAGGGATQTVLVEDFVFNPANITIAAGDVVEWQWVGAVAHTATSDAASGPDAWDSGLLNTGATYTSPALSAGVHPYYCIPHGAPGGTGMAGTITVQANCSNGEVAVSLSFNASGGGFGGYNILVDGQATPNSPFAYDASGVNSAAIFVPGDGQAHVIQIQDVDDPACAATTTITTPDCNAPTCQLSATAAEAGGCGANDNVPVEVTVNDVGGGSSFTVLVDGQSAGSFSYSGNGTTVVSIGIIGDGQPHSIEVVDAADPNCTASTSITTTNCLIPCSLSNLSASTGGGATQTVLVEDFVFNPANITIAAGDVVEWQWVGAVAHTATSDAASGPDAWDSGLLNTGATYTSPALSAGVHPYYCIPHGAPGGTGMAGTITVQANCSNGEVAVSLSFNASGGGFGGYNILVDGQVIPNSPLAYDASGVNSAAIFVPGDGQAHVIQVQDVDDPACAATTTITTPDCNAPTCQLSASAAEAGGCGANDNVPVEVTVNDVGGGSSFTVLVDGQSAGSFSYSGNGTTVVSIGIIGDGQPHSIEVVDAADPNCTASTSITTTNCLIPCSLSNLSASTGGGATQTVLVEDFVFNPANITIAAGDVVEWQWVGAVAHTATSDAASGPDAWDSGLLNTGATYTSPALSAGVHPYYCIPHGAPGGTGMAGTITVQANCSNGEVAVSLSFNASGGGFGGYNILVDGQATPNSPFAYDASGVNSAAIFVPGDGQAHVIQIQDVDDPACTVSTTITTPDCNAPTCQLSATAAEAGGCGANDNVPVEVTVNDVGGGSSFTVLVDGQSAGSFSYSGNGTTVVSIGIIGDGQPHSIEVVDAADPNCTASTSITTTNCLIPCSLSNLSASTGGGATQTVLVEDFVFNPANITIAAGDVVEWQWVGAVAHTATSDATSGPDAWDSGLLNTGATYTSPALSAGVHPYYCIPHGAPGGTGMAGTITVQANCSNGEVAVSLSFNASGGGFGGYNILVDGQATPNSPFAYDASGVNSAAIFVPGDGQAHVIQIQDVDDPACTVSTTITTPDCNAPTCQLSATATEAGGCGANDNVPVEVTVNDVGGGSSFTVLVDGQSAGSFSYSGNGTTVVSIDVIGDGQPHSIEVVDAADPNCTASTSITTTNCLIPCSLSNLSASTGGGATQTVLVEDFVFNPANITIAAGDVVEWQWVGAVAHTATSDAASGPDAWDSGLLNTGATYTSPALSAGVHPYYCIPHGAPGGTGMAGTITVQANCSNGEVAVSLSFNASGGGFGGYNILLDGQATPNSPFAYDASGVNSAAIFVPGDGQAHVIQVQDVDDPACAATTTVTTPDCNAPTCQLSATATEAGGCGANDNVPVEVTVNDVGGGSSFTVLVDGQSAGSFSYSGNGTTVVSIGIIGDGQLHSIEVVDAADPNCTASTNLTIRNCTIPCQFSDLVLGTAGSGMPTTHTVEVKDFEFVPKDITIAAGDIVDFQWTGAIAHTATSDSPNQSDAFDSGLLNQGDHFQVTITQEGLHPYYCIPHGAPGGVGMAGTITATPPPPPCDANGQVTLNVSFTAIGNGNTGFVVLVDGQPRGGINPYNANGAQQVNVLVDGDGQAHTIEIRDADNAVCSISGNIVLPNCDPPMPCDLSLEISQIADCDATDSIGVELILISDNESASGFNIFVEGDLISGSPYFYDSNDTTNVTLNLDGNGALQTIEVVDVDSANCSAITSFQTPNCFQFCQITDLAVSGNAPNKHFVEVKDFEFVPAQLDILVGDTVEFFWTGAISHTSTSDAISGTNSWDSGLLSAGDTYQVVITEAGMHPYYCIPHGGPNGIGQSGVIQALSPCSDTTAVLAVSFSANLGGTQGYQVFLDGNQIAGPLNYDDPNGDNTAVISIPADGNIHLLTVQDLETSFCAATIQFEAPDCEMVDCNIDILSIEFPQSTTHIVEVKDFVFEPKDLTINLGDTVHFVWTGAIPHTSTSDALTGEDVWESGLLGQGATFDVIIQNEGVHPYYCVPHGGPGGIGMAGTITALDNNCQNGLVSAELSFAHQGTSNSGYNVLVDGSLLPNSPMSYNIGIDGLSIDLPGDGALHTIIVADFEDASCADTISVVTENCSLGCALAASFEPIGDCDSNDEIAFEITVENENSGSQFSVQVDSNTPESYDYDPSGTTIVPVSLSGDGSTYTILIQDADSSNCATTLAIPTEDCSPSCEIALSSSQLGGCDGNGEVPYELMVSANHFGGAGFQLYIDGLAFSPNSLAYDGATTLLNAGLPGDGQAHELVVTDLEFLDCSDTLQITTPDCGESCSLANLTIDFEAPQTHEVDVLDFVFEPRDITVNVGDTVRFVWIGVIPHTATSDATTGDDVFNSGLLGEGEVFDVVITTAGFHPYYCIPHGSPGGIGMAGSITAVADCDDSQLNMAFSFEAENSGFSGYDVYLDGNFENSFAYTTNNPQHFGLTLPAEGQMANLIIQDGEDASCLIDTVFQMPNCNDPCFGFEAAFDVVIDHVNLTAQFTSLASDASAWLWTFGEGGASVLETPAYQYAEAGTYEVCLAVQNNDGCESQSCTAITVGEYLCEPNFYFEIDGLTLSLFDASITTDSIVQRIWNLGNQTYMVGTENPVYTYDSLGVYTVCLSIEAGVCEADTCITIDLSDECLAFRPGFDYVINNEDLTIQFIDQTTGNPNQWLWGFGDANTSNEQNPEHTYSQPGNYNVCLLVQNTDVGCNASHCEAISIGTVSTTGVVRRNFSLNIYPNPSPRNNLAWTLEGIQERDYNKNLALKIYDVQGKTVTQSNTRGAERMSFRLERGLASGVYFIELRSENGVYRGKVVVE